MPIRSVPEDVTRALAALSARASKHPQYTLRVDPPTPKTWSEVRDSPGPCQLPPERSPLPAGREVYLWLDGPGTVEARLGLLWGLAVPLGFVPWQRYPEPGTTEHVFHCWGPWRLIEDHLITAGRGESAWPSLCAAAQSEIGAWEGPQALSRLVQAHLHRLGHACGPVDGIVGPMTSQALAAAGLGKLSLEEALAQLAARIPTQPVASRAPRRGRLELDVPAIVHASGGVRSVRTPHGFMLTISGEGRLVVDVGI